MDRETQPDLQVETWLRILGITSLCQWDVLVFLCRHQASLLNAEHLSRLLGHPTGEIVTALGALESLGVVQRSRVDQGVRLYQLAAPEDPRWADALSQLSNLATSRAGRLLLFRKLRRGKLLNQSNGLCRGKDVRRG